MTGPSLPARPSKPQFDALDLVATGTVWFTYDIGRYPGEGRYYESTPKPLPHGKLSKPVYKRLWSTGLIRLVDTDNRNVCRVELTKDGIYAQSLRHKVFSVSNVWAPRLRAALNDEGHAAQHAYVVAVNLNHAQQALDARNLRLNMHGRSEIRLAHPGHSSVDALRYTGMITGHRVLVTPCAHARAAVLDVKIDGDTPLAGWFDYSDEHGYEPFFRPAREG